MGTGGDCRELGSVSKRPEGGPDPDLPEQIGVRGPVRREIESDTGALDRGRIRGNLHQQVSALRSFSSQ